MPISPGSQPEKWRVNLSRVRCSNGVEGTLLISSLPSSGDPFIRTQKAAALLGRLQLNQRFQVL
ncbi:MAG: hypothetical protein ABFD21_07610 [Anaerolineaceae bacterium]|jgi:hypothetical protein